MDEGDEGVDCYYIVGVWLVDVRKGDDDIDRVRVLYDE